MWWITIAVLLFSVIAWFVLKSLYPGAPPQLDQEEWWGPNDLKGKQDTTIRPFQIKFSEQMINDLKQRLKNLRQPVPPLEDQAFKYGFNSNQLSCWIKYWADEYPFAERENFLNQYPQFKTNIQGLDVHFIRVTPEVPPTVTVVPLLLVHGWPGSVREFYEAIPLLTKPLEGADFAFELIIPSLPGYGFSDAPVRPGLGPAKIAVVFKNLMARLGFTKYYVQGGDWGSIVVAAMATMFPEHVLGQHSNMLFVSNNCAKLKILLGAVLPSLVIDSDVAHRIYPLTSYFAHLVLELGYMHLQATKPDTIGELIFSFLYSLVRAYYRTFDDG
ncbi:unnamed protein product [Leptidea sinapis]|uniref:Epoxide hydrolase n=1 Tax=Leptidea sinapis TaxID=189913 RepID=A0A5E4QDE5_9NEOP|nr:unnamed protein product [Leptidea sinapis]